jgi:glycerate kinase
MKFVLAPDKFKGSLTAFEACHAMETGIRQVIPFADIHSFPMADGGDGFSAVMGHYLETEPIECSTVDALGKSIRAFYRTGQQGALAIIETATASGLAQLTQSKGNALQANTFGTGLLIKDALDRGATTIMLGLGGSATTDMGTGILQALGFRFLDANGHALTVCGEALLSIYEVRIPDNIPAVKFILACDVTNPLYGPDGAAFVFAPQKGANAEMVKMLDAGLLYANRLFGKYSGRDPSTIPGSGAAGGIAAGLAHFFDVDLKSGFDIVLSASGLKEALPGAHWLLTGEGRFDAQSFDGKVTGKLIEISKKNGVPCGLFCGKMESAQVMQTMGGPEYLSFMVKNELKEEEAIKHAYQMLMAETAAFASGLLH